MKKIIFILLLIGCQYAKSQCPEGSITSEQNLIINGDFEENTPIESDYIKNGVDAGTYRILDDASTYSETFFTGKGDGLFMAVDGSEVLDKTVWKQTINVQKNTNYYFSCWVNTLNIKTGPPAVLQFLVNDRFLDKPFNCPDKLNEWKQFSVLWNSGNNNKIVIRIVSQNAYLDGNDFGLDRIKFYECKDTNIKIEENKSIVLENVFFKTNSALILETSFSELNKLVEYLTQNPNKTIVISGHTDNVGNEKSNQKLSEERAQSIKNYLIQKSIDTRRITSLGYGESKPIENNETIDGRKKNRRVEFVIM